MLYSHGIIINLKQLKLDC